MTTNFFEQLFVHLRGTDDLLAAAIEHVGFRPITSFKAVERVGDGRGLPRVEGVEFPSPHTRRFFAATRGVVFHGGAFTFRPRRQQGVGPSPRGVVEQRDGDVRHLGRFVPFRGTLGDNGTHDPRDGAGQIRDRPLEDGGRFFGDGWNDVVDQLELFLHLDHLFLLFKVLSETASHLEHSLANFVHHFAVVGEGLLGF